MAKGRTIDEIRENGTALERDLIEMQLKFERELQADEIAFLDRGLPDSLTYFHVAGLNPNEILTECFRHRYASIFVLDRIPMQRNNIRTEDDVIASLIDEWHTRDCSALGYSVVKVPVLSPQERLSFVLERLSKQGLI
jgi:predicted ATPase